MSLKFRWGDDRDIDRVGMGEGGRQGNGRGRSPRRGQEESGMKTGGEREASE